MGPKGVAGLWGRGTSRWSCIPRMPWFDLWLDAFFLFFRIWANGIKYKSAHARYRYKITAGFYFIHFQVGWNPDNTLIYSCLICLQPCSGANTTLFYFLSILIELVPLKEQVQIIHHSTILFSPRSINISNEIQPSSVLFNSGCSNLSCNIILLFYSEKGISLKEFLRKILRHHSKDTYIYILQYTNKLKVLCINFL